MFACPDMLDWWQLDLTKYSLITNAKITEGRQIKSSMLPAYCDPPNPCPLGYTAQVRVHLGWLTSPAIESNIRFGTSCHSPFLMWDFLHPGWLHWGFWKQLRILSKVPGRSYSLMIMSANVLYVSNSQHIRSKWHCFVIWLKFAKIWITLYCDLIEVCRLLKTACAILNTCLHALKPNSRCL